MCGSRSDLIVRCCLEEWEVAGKRKKMKWQGMKAVWTHWRMNEAGIAGLGGGGSYYYGEKLRTEIKSEIGGR